jgi:hypothetical protein
MEVGGVLILICMVGYLMSSKILSWRELLRVMGVSLVAAVELI